MAVDQSDCCDTGFEHMSTRFKAVRSHHVACQVVLELDHILGSPIKVSTSSVPPEKAHPKAQYPDTQSHRPPGHYQSATLLHPPPISRR